MIWILAFMSVMTFYAFIAAVGETRKNQRKN
jgi:hypothetical protein